MDGQPTNGSLAPSAATLGNNGAEFDKSVLLDPSATNLTQSTMSSSSFVAGKHMLGKAFIKPFSAAEPLLQAMVIIQLKLLNISDVKLSAVKKMFGPLSDVSDDINQIQSVFNSTETVQDEDVETVKNFASSPPEIGT